MYTPDITGDESCGFIVPPLTDWERENACDSIPLVDTMRCLYKREFNPLYAEKDCSCITCYEPSVWSHIIQHASHLNKNLIWNDIIKRWEPVEFNQELGETEAVDMSYEFRTYKDIYGIDIDGYNSACATCPAFGESTRGIGFIKATSNYDTTDSTEGCCLCNSLNPKIVLQYNDGVNWVSEHDNANLSNYTYSLNSGYEYRLLISLNQIYINDYFISCGNHVWKVDMGDYEYVGEETGYVLSENIPLTGEVSGTIDVSFIDVLDPAQTFKCSYNWKFTAQ